MKKTLITHNSVFHADEVMATAILSCFYNRSNVTILRTNKVDKYVNDENTIIYDIGFGKYDHHQKGGNGVRKNGVPYAACGLIWKDFGKDLIAKTASNMDIELTYEEVNKIFEIIDTLIIQGIDANDNGYRAKNYVKPEVNHYNISNIVFSLNTISYDGGVTSSQQDFNFISAVDICVKILIANIRKYADTIAAEKHLQKLIDSRENKRVLVLDKYIPWIKYVVENNDDIWYVVFPSARNAGEYNMQAVQISVDSFDQRHPVPKEWWGGNTDTLPEITGVQGATFCHQSNGFLTAARGLEDMMKLASLAVEEKVHV